MMKREFRFNSHVYRLWHRNMFVKLDVDCCIWMKRLLRRIIRSMNRMFQFKLKLIDSSHCRVIIAIAKDLIRFYLIFGLFLIDLFSKRLSSNKTDAIYLAILRWTDLHIKENLIEFCVITVLFYHKKKCDAYVFDGKKKTSWEILMW